MLPAAGAADGRPAMGLARLPLRRPVGGLRRAGRGLCAVAGAARGPGHHPLPRPAHALDWHGGAGLVLAGHVEPDGM